MKYLVKLSFDKVDEFDEIDDEFDENDEEFDEFDVGRGFVFFENEENGLLAINLSVDPSKKLTNDYIRSLLKNYLSGYDFMINETADVKIAKALLKKKINILDNTLGFVLPNDLKTSDYLKNLDIQDKKLYLDGIYDTTQSDLDLVLNVAGDKKDIYLKVEGNNNYVTVLEYENTVKAINEIVEKIKKYNLSPFEQIMYAYDLVRERIYKFEAKGDSPTKSRDLTSVLSGDRIVCVGYAVLLKAILRNFSINAENYIIEHKTKPLAHQRSMIYVLDPKYNIDGVFFFDPTFDSRKKENDNSYLNNYRNFAVTKEKSEVGLEDFVSRNLPGFDRDFIPKLKTIILEKGIKNVPADMINTINRVAIFLDGEVLIKRVMLNDTFNSVNIPEIFRKNYTFDHEKTFETLDRYQRLFFESSISGPDFLRALYNVRKVEYYDDPKKYPFDAVAIEKAARAYPENIYTRMFYEIHGNPDERIDEEGLAKVFEEDKIAENIEQVKITNLVRDYYERKKSR